MESSTLHSNLSSTSLPGGLNRPRFYDDLEPMSPNELTDNDEYGSYKVQNSVPWVIDDDLICGCEEPQKKLKVQENKAVIVSSRNNPEEQVNTKTNYIKASLNKDQVPKNRRNSVQPSICQVINVDDDDEDGDEDEDDVEIINDNEDCVILEKPVEKKADESLVIKDNVSDAYAAIVKKRIEEEHYRKAVEYRQRQYFMAYQNRMRQYMYYMAYQNRMQGTQQQWNHMVKSINQFGYGRGMGIGQKFEDGAQSLSDEQNLADQSTSASTSVSHEQRYQPLQISITLDKETDFDLLGQQEDCDGLNTQNISILEQNFYLEQTANEVIRRKRGRPRKYPQSESNIPQESGVPTVKVRKTIKKQKIIETVVGDEFQVQIPPYSFNNKKQNSSKRTLKLMWNPDLIQKDTLDTFLADLSKVTRQEISNEETALHLLQSYGMDSAQTLEMVRKNKQLYRKVFEVVVKNSSDKV